VRGRCRRRCGEDGFPNAFDISKYFIIPKAQHTVAMIDEPSISDDVARVDLDWLRPSLKSAFGARRTRTSRQNRLDWLKVPITDRARGKIGVIPDLHVIG
jgi:hypothetical protein